MREAKIFESIFNNDPILCGLYLLDVLIIAVRVHKVYHSMFDVWYFSFGALIKELIIIFFAAGMILGVGPLILMKTGLLNSTTLYVYAGAVFLLSCRRKSKKQQPDTQGQEPQQEQPSTTTTPQQPNKSKKSKTIVFVVLIIVLGTALQGFQKFAKHREAQRRFEASLPKDEAAQKRIEQAKELITRAENGDDDAQLRLAISLMEMVMKTDGAISSLNEDLVQALSFLHKSYKQGNVEAQFLIAFSYFMQGNKKEECFKLMKPIAEKDPATIKKVYGIADKDGNKPYSSPEEMVALAQLVIATLYADGAGTEKNLEQAEYWLKKSLEHGSEFVKEMAPQLLESLRTEKTGKAQTHTTKTQSKTQPQPQSAQRSTPNDTEYQQMLLDPEFAKADKALNNAWQNAEKSLSANAFNVLKQDQQKWISSGSTGWTKILTDEEGEYAYPKTKAYAITTQARANYISLWAKGYRAASVTGDKVNVRRKPNTKGKVLFQVSRYLY